MCLHDVSLTQGPAPKRSLLGTWIFTLVLVLSCKMDSSALVHCGGLRQDHGSSLDWAHGLHLSLAGTEVP